MSQYKVGDVASLFEKSSLQSLFEQHTKKVKKRNIEKDSEVSVTKQEAKRKRPNVLHKNERNSKKIKFDKETKFKRSSKKERKLQSESLEVQTADENDLFDSTADDNNDCEEQVPNKQKKKKTKSETLAGDKNEIADKAPLQNDDDLPSTLFVGNLPVSMSKKILQEQFQPFGPLKTIRFRGAVPVRRGIPKRVAEIRKQYHEGVKTHIAYVVFKDRASALGALSLNGTLMNGHHIVVDFAKNIGEKKMYDNNLSVFIGSLPYDVSDEEVWSTFEACGEVHAVRVVRDKATGVGKGIGYVQFQTDDAKKRALSMKGVEIGGRRLRIKAVETTAPHKDSSKKALMRIRTHLAQSRGNKRKSVKKLLKKGRREHQHKKFAQMLQKKPRNA